jgi:thiamine pyrophosphate-dependent acetolactate synthase large subunit-like protein
MDGTDRWSLIPAARACFTLISIRQEIGRNYEAVRLLGDARATLDALANALDNHTRDQGGIERRVSDAWAAFEQERAPFLGDSQPIRAERVLGAIQKPQPARPAGESLTATKSVLLFADCKHYRKRKKNAPTLPIKAQVPGAKRFDRGFLSILVAPI